MTRLLRLVLYVAALIISYPASWLNRIHYSGRWPAQFARGYQATRHCVLCGASMARDFRTERDARRANGTVKRIGEDVLNWWRCPGGDEGCGQSQQGEMKV